MAITNFSYYAGDWMWCTLFLVLDRRIFSLNCHNVHPIDNIRIFDKNLKQSTFWIDNAIVSNIVSIDLVLDKYL